MNRTDMITDRLQATLRAHECTALLLSAEQWRGLPVSRFRFGWAPGVGTPAVALLCPELIAATTTTLDADLLDHYLATIEAFLVAHLERPGQSSAEIMAQAEAELYAVAPATLALMSEVELYALDNHLV